MSAIITKQVLQTLYYTTGTGWQPVQATATSYATKEAAMVDAITQREALGPSVPLTIVEDTGTVHQVPNFQ